MKTLTDETEINSLIRKLRNAEQVRAVSENGDEYLASFEIVREDTENSLVYKKIYRICPERVFVSAYTADKNTGEVKNSDYDNSYIFGISEEFAEIMREYFDEDFTFRE